MSETSERILKKASYEKNRVVIRIWTLEGKESDLDIGHISIETPDNPPIILWCCALGKIKEFYNSIRFKNFFDEKSFDFVVTVGQDRVFEGKRTPDKVFCLYTLSADAIYQKFYDRRFEPRSGFSPYVKNVLLSNYPGACAKMAFDLLSEGGLTINSSNHISLIQFLTDAKKAELNAHPGTALISNPEETPLIQDTSRCVIL